MTTKNFSFTFLWKKCSFEVVRSQKIGLRQKYIILLSRKAILLLKESFKTEKIIFHETKFVI